MTTPTLRTEVVGSYSMPSWLERLKAEYFLRRISRHALDEIHETAVNAAIKDQEVAGLEAGRIWTCSRSSRIPSSSASE